MADQKGKSPYKKYNKRPHVYSTLYKEWKTARNKGYGNESRLLGDKHSKHYLNIDPDKEAAE